MAHNDFRQFLEKAKWLSPKIFQGHLSWFCRHRSTACQNAAGKSSGTGLYDPYLQE